MVVIPEVFLGKGILKIYCKITGEYSCRSVISIKLQSKLESCQVANRTLAWMLSCTFAAYFAAYLHLFQRTPLGGCFCYFFLSQEGSYFPRPCLTFLLKIYISTCNKLFRRNNWWKFVLDTAYGYSKQWNF